VVEDDRAGLGDPDGRSGDDAVESVQLGGRQSGVLDGAGDVEIESGRYDDACARGQRGADPLGDLLGRAALHDGPVVGDPLGEE
jgi:hypothetical protein